MSVVLKMSPCAHMMYDLSERWTPYISLEAVNAHLKYFCKERRIDSLLTPKRDY